MKTREEMIKDLVEYDLYILDGRTLQKTKDLLLNGFVGYKNMSDTDLIKEHKMCCPED